jgi:hypothetical protein|tara:strand:+ start:152 stop:691 length:540 start_codon:yes stop_codon:yes gene_type:complete
MQISNVKTAILIGKFAINDGTSKARLKLNYENISKDVLKDDAGRVYLLVKNGEIMKIGGSISKGGIKSTMSFYLSANTGRPSIRSFGINQLVYEAIEKGEEVSIYMITSEQVSAPVKGLFGSETLSISAFKEMEEKCLADYVAISGRFPAWNYQESGRPWEQYIQEAHAIILTKSAKRQ